LEEYSLEEQVIQETSMKQISSRAAETSAKFQRNTRTRSYVPKNITLHDHLVKDYRDMFKAEQARKSSPTMEN
jgi:hypothetical protein